MPDKLTDSEIIKEIQGIKESMKRHIDLTNEIGQDLLRIDEEYTGGSKVWLTTDYFKKVVKHFCHSNYLVKCLELVFDLINRLQEKIKFAENINHLQMEEMQSLKEKNKVLSNELANSLQDAENKQAEIERFKSIKNVYDFAEYRKQEIKAEAYKEFAEIVKANKRKLFNYIYSSTGFDNQIDNLLNEMVGEDNESKD